jgi:hypothetical protein
MKFGVGMKGKIIPIPAMKTYRATENIAACILTLTSRVVSLMPHLLYQGKNKMLSGPQSWSGRFGEEINLFSLLGFEHLIFQPKPSHYIDYTTSAPIWYNSSIQKSSREIVSFVKIGSVTVIH